MPEGFEKQMTARELAYLLEFLNSKGKFLPVSLDRYATAIGTKGLFGIGDDGPDSTAPVVMAVTIERM